MAGVRLTALENVQTLLEYVYIIIYICIYKCMNLQTIKRIALPTCMYVVKKFNTSSFIE